MRADYLDSGFEGWLAPAFLGPMKRPGSLWLMQRSNWRAIAEYDGGLAQSRKGKPTNTAIWQTRQSAPHVAQAQCNIQTIGSQEMIAPPAWMAMRVPSDQRCSTGSAKCGIKGAEWGIDCVRAILPRCPANDVPCARLLRNPTKTAMATPSYADMTDLFLHQRKECVNRKIAKCAQCAQYLPAMYAQPCARIGINPKWIS